MPADGRDRLQRIVKGLAQTLYALQRTGSGTWLSVALAPEIMHN